MIEYTVKQTRRGDYIVKMAHNNREVGRAGTEEEANAIADDLRKKDAERAEADSQREAVDSEFSGNTPDLTKLQLRWQNWRNWYYNELVHEERRVASARRAIDRADSNALSYQKHEQDVCEDEQVVSKARQLYESMVIPADGAIKRARRARDASELEAALTAAESVIEAMRGQFPSYAPADEYRPIPHKPGTKPNTTLILSADEIAYCAANGGKSKVIHQLLRQAMEQDDVR